MNTHDLSFDDMKVNFLMLQWGKSFYFKWGDEKGCFQMPAQFCSFEKSAAHQNTFFKNYSSSTLDLQLLLSQVPSPKSPACWLMWVWMTVWLLTPKKNQLRKCSWCSRFLPRSRLDYRAFTIMKESKRSNIRIIFW